MSDDGLPPGVGGPARPDKQRVPDRTSSPAPWIVGGLVVLVVVGGLVAFVSGSQDDEGGDATEMDLTPLDPADAPRPPEGVEAVEITARNHVEGEVDYETTPGVGGDHADVWINCGFYSEPQSEEQAVHSLEHGAVWVAYRPELAEDQMQALRELAAQPFTLVSPVEGLASDVVASAWGARLELNDVDDPRLPEFLEFFRQGPQTPEPGAPCTSGVGTPS